MGKVGLEPTRIAPRDPKSRSSASSDTPPLGYYTRNLIRLQLPARGASSGEYRRTKSKKFLKMRSWLPSSTS
jgi:hypothetical protein